MVFKARSPDGRLVAIKSLRNLDDDPSLRDRFLHELHLVQNLIHPNIVIPFEVHLEPAPYIVMEYVAGFPLTYFRRAGMMLDLEAVAEIIEQIADGLSYVHDLGIAHGDLNPQNIMITKDHRKQLLVKLLDFGIAKHSAIRIKVGGLEADDPLPSLDLPGAFGTPGYISPELFDKKTIDRMADLFSFGVIAHELITGRSPFPGRDPWRTLNKPQIMDITPGFRRIFQKALHRNPARRYASAQSFTHRLTRLFGTQEFRIMMLEVALGVSGSGKTKGGICSTQDIVQWEMESEGILGSRGDE